MRWSLSSLYVLLSVVIVAVTANPVPPNAAEAVVERSGVVYQKPKAAQFKKSSSTYRNAAAKSTNPMFSLKNGKITRGNAHGQKAKGYDADHILEAQVVAHAATKAGYSNQDIQPALKDVKQRLNAPSNMAFTPPAINRAKGQIHGAVLNGKAPKRYPPAVKGYMKQTAAAGKATAKDIDAIFQKHGLSKVDVSGAHQKVLKSQGIKRRAPEYYEADLD